MAATRASSSWTVPKYTIRVALIWLVPIVSALMGRVLLVPFLLSMGLTPIELPKVRTRLFGPKSRKMLPCLRAPALMRLAVLWVLHIWWVVLWNVETSLEPAEAVATEGDVLAAVGEEGVPMPGMGAVRDYGWSPQTFSVVLPCAGEAAYALNTVRAVHETTPAEALAEIIVVDDGSTPPLSESHLTEDVQKKYGVRVIRHETTVGLIGAKKDGGDAAKGDIVVFFDCHVAPQPGWHSSFLRLASENYRRIVVPVITDLDVGTWRQRRGNKGMGKCYLTWDADFKWFTSSDPYVPVVSGGLLAISKRWWNETGGYDEHMVGWGGENLDQSLRSWLCGGEIVLAKDAHVAHMWRIASDPRTAARYHVKPGAAHANRMRAAVAWFGEFSEKLAQFPAMHAKELAPGGGPWYGSVQNILDVKERLQCRSFAWFMKRFKHVYEDGGLVPVETFLLRASGASSGSHPLCLAYTGQAGTSHDGKGQAKLLPCDASDDRQRWHGANRDVSREDQSCCSGFRAWNTDQCLTGAQGGAAHTAVCDITGKAPSQLWMLTENGLLQDTRDKGINFMDSAKCLEVDSSGLIRSLACSSSAGPTWVKDSAEEPIESTLYRKALAA
mmetsp:Transcript_87453/g.245491  ORF Transcript_87453/g.245491 Transcript_87453/m.245491 type:complete len:612 (-) Transcript_87453:53-1888(-)